MQLNKIAMNDNSKAPQILNTSANLFGICFAVFSYLRILKIGGETYIDESAAVSMFLFMISCFSSFLSIRSKSARTMMYETIADYVFIAGMLTLFFTTLLIVFKVML